MNPTKPSSRPTQVVTATHVSVAVVMIAAVAALGLGTLAFLSWYQR